MMPELPDERNASNITPALVAMGMRAMGQRIYSYLGLLLTAGGFGYVEYDPSVLRIVTVGLFAMFVVVSSHAMKGARQ